MLKILVTGGAGFIGSHFVERCVRENHSVVVLDALTYAGHRENLPASVPLIEGDIGDGPLVAKLLRDHQIDVIFNFAAESHVDRSISEASPFLQTNVMGTVNLLSEALTHYLSLTGDRKDRFRFVQISTDEVFGDLGPDGFFTEASPFAPNSPYSASKASADLFVRAWNHTYGLPTISTHCSNNYGPRQYPEKLIPLMIRHALVGKPLGIYGDGSNVRDWIHVEDHCYGVWLAFEKGVPGERYCFGGRTEKSNRDGVEQIVQILDHWHPRADGLSYRQQIQFITDRLGHDRRYAIDDSLAETQLGFRRNFTDFTQGLTETIKWYLAHSSWCDTVLAPKTSPSKENSRTLEGTPQMKLAKSLWALLLGGAALVVLVLCFYRPIYVDEVGSRIIHSRASIEGLDYMSHLFAALCPSTENAPTPLFWVLPRAVTSALFSVADTPAAHRSIGVLAYLVCLGLALMIAQRISRFSILGMTKNFEIYGVLILPLCLGVMPFLAVSTRPETSLLLHILLLTGLCVESLKTSLSKAYSFCSLVYLF